MDIREHGKQLIRDSAMRARQSGDNVVNRVNPRVLGPQMDDVTNMYAQHELSKMNAPIPIYRTVRLITHAKYSHESKTSTRNATWTLANFHNGRGNISVKTELLDNLISIGIEPFLLPLSMISDGELAMRTLAIYFTSITSPEFVMYDYRGALDNMVASPVHVNCNIVNNDSWTVRIVPNVDKIVFSTPASLRELWGISFYSPVKQLTIPPVVLDAVAVSSNPLRLTIPSHGLNGEYITIDTGDFPTAYTTLDTVYATALVDPDTISVTAVNGSSVTNGTKLQITVLSRAFRIPLTFTCLDRRRDPPINVGVALTM